MDPRYPRHPRQTLTHTTHEPTNPCCVLHPLHPRYPRHPRYLADSIDNNLIVHNLLINYLNLIKKLMQKQLLTSVLQNSCLRCSRSQMFFKIGVLKNFVIFTGKYLCWSLFLIKLTPKTPKRLQHRCFFVNIAKFSRTPFLRNTSGGCFCCFKKFVHSQENISGGGLTRLSF